MNDVNGLWERSLAANDTATWVTAAAVLVATLVGLFAVRHYLVHRLRRMGEKSPERWHLGRLADLGGKTNLLVVIAAAVVAAQFLELPAAVDSVLDTVFLLGLLLQAAIIGGALIGLWLERYRLENLEDDPSSVTMISALGVIGKAALYVIVVLLALDNLGFQVSALLAGLGIAGLAIGLALQNILGDLFASLVIVFDKPFVIGDFIMVGDMMGTVQHIGIKTTRVESLSGEQLVFSNTDLVSSRLHNYKRLQERRIVFGFGVLYQTPYEKLKEIPRMVEEIVSSAHKARFDRAHFASYGDSSLDFEVVYYVLDPDYALYMDIQQEVNLGLFKRFEEEGIEFAYPTRTILLEQTAVDAGNGAANDG